MIECDEKLRTKNVPHIFEKIFLSMDYKSFKTCFEVCKMWSEFILSDSIQRKAKLVFSIEVVKDASKLLKASRDGNQSDHKTTFHSNVGHK